MITRDVKIFLVIYKSHIQGKSLQVFTSIFAKIHSGVSKSVLCNVADRFLNTDKSEILNRRPVAYLVCNQSPPGADGTPSLMTFREVETLFHEVGESFYSSSILVWPRRLWFQKPRTRRPFQYFTPLKIWSLACIMGGGGRGGRGFGRMEENEKKGRDTQVCRYSAFSDPLRFPQRLAYSWEFWYDSWGDYNFKSHSYTGNAVLVICRCEILVVSSVLNSSLEFSALGCLKPTLAGKSSNRIPASYGNYTIKIKKKPTIYTLLINFIH